MSADALDELFTRFVAHHVEHGERLDVTALLADKPELRAALEERIRCYLDLDQALDGAAAAPAAPPGAEGVPLAAVADALPTFVGFQTVERIGAGGAGEVYKLRDLRLDRFVAAKVIRPDAVLKTSLDDFMREARSLALFKDERIVQVYELRVDAARPAILMEYVEGFPLGRVGPSLEFSQRARVLLDVCEALHRAHGAGVQHRDLKPTNILLDATLRPKLVDFGLAGSDPRSGHFRGTLHYLAPEQLDLSKPIDARADVYALGVVFYELLCGAVPYSGATLEAQVALQRRAQPRLPVEVDPAVPEPLQAIALKAMETDPRLRYGSAAELALDLRRYLDGRPVLARPSHYSSALARRLRPQLDAVEEWLRLKLIYPHEAERLHEAYQRLEARDDDWIVESRRLSWSQVALYLGALALAGGGGLYFIASRFFGDGPGPLEALASLGLPFVALQVAARRLYRGEHKAVAVAWFSGSVFLLPALLLTVLHTAGWLDVAKGTEGQLFSSAAVSNHQLQLALFVTTGWGAWLALRTRTVGLSAVTTALAFLLYLALLGDRGLRGWLARGEWDVLAAYLFPLVVVFAVAAVGLERLQRSWFARPLYLAAAVVLIVALELSALNGKAFLHLGLSMAGLGPAQPANPTLLDTLTAMSLAGLGFYGVATVVDLRGPLSARPAAVLLFLVAPFAILEPVAVLVQSAQYAPMFDWLYLGLAVGVAVASSHRERRAFFYAGALNTAIALFFVTHHRHWFEEAWWAVAVLCGGLVVLGLGLALDVRERRRRRLG